MKWKEEKNMLNKTFDNMSMGEERSEEILRELINYNTELENKEEKRDMREKKVAVGENLHEISPKNNKNNRWQYVFGSLCIVAVAALGFFIWNNRGINNIGGKSVPGSNVQREETTAGEVLADNNTDSAEETNNRDTVFDMVTGDGQKITVKTSVKDYEQNDPIYEIEAGDIRMLLKKDYNYNLYSRQTNEGLEMLAVGVRKEGSTYYYIYSMQIKPSDDNIIEETGKISDGTASETQGALDGSSITPEFVEVKFTEGESYIGSRDRLIDELSSFYNTVNEFIDGKEPQEKCKQNGIEGEIDGSEFEYKILKEAEASYVTCGIKEPIDSRFDLYFRYVDGEIGYDVACMADIFYSRGIVMSGGLRVYETNKQEKGRRIKGLILTKQHDYDILFMHGQCIL